MGGPNALNMSFDLPRNLVNNSTRNAKERNLEWLVDHREAIGSHIGHAIAKLMVGDEEATLVHGPALKPLKMPKVVIDMRLRPLSYSEDEWFVFGDEKPYDVIQVDSQ